MGGGKHDHILCGETLLFLELFGETGPGWSVLVAFQSFVDPSLGVMAFLMFPGLWMCAYPYHGFSTGIPPLLLFSLKIFWAISYFKS